MGHFTFFARFLPDKIGFIVRWMRLVAYSVHFAAMLHGALCLVLIVWFARLLSTACTSRCTVLYMSVTWKNKTEAGKKIMREIRRNLEG